MGVTLGILRYTVRAATPALALGTAVLTAVLAACSDSPTGPAAVPAASAVRSAAHPVGPRSDPPSAAKAPGRAPAPTSGVRVQARLGDTTVTTLVLEPDSGFVVAALGDGHTITFPAGARSVCDPRTSSYGVGAWDAPCAPSVDSVTITARSWMDHGVPRVAFHPALRFVPTTAGKAPATNAGVVLALKNPHAKFTGRVNRIDYCPTIDAAHPAAPSPCVDESATDPSVATVMTPSGFWQRRVKHFSGYTVLVN